MDACWRFREEWGYVYQSDAGGSEGGSGVLSEAMEECRGMQGIEREASGGQREGEGWRYGLSGTWKSAECEEGGEAGEFYTVGCVEDDFGGAW